jgi:hypothetical protein
MLKSFRQRRLSYRRLATGWIAEWFIREKWKRRPASSSNPTFAGFDPTLIRPQSELAPSLIRLGSDLNPALIQLNPG